LIQTIKHRLNQLRFLSSDFKEELNNLTNLLTLLDAESNTYEDEDEDDFGGLLDGDFELDFMLMGESFLYKRISDSGEWSITYSLTHNTDPDHQKKLVDTKLNRQCIYQGPNLCNGHYFERERNEIDKKSLEKIKNLEGFDLEHTTLNGFYEFLEIICTSMESIKYGWTSIHDY
jgi:hypothetical protein